MKLRLAHYRNRFSPFRIYYAIRAGIVKADGIDITVTEVPDPPSRELEEALLRGDVDFANVYFLHYIERRLQGLPVIGLCTEWKSTAKGNGMFVRRGTIAHPAGLAGRVIANHQGLHTIHSYLLKTAYGVDIASLRWKASPQAALIDILTRGEADAAILIDHYFHRGEHTDGIHCLYTDGDAWAAMTGFEELIKHVVVASEPLMRRNPGLRTDLLDLLRRSFSYGERNLEEVADAFLKAKGGDRADLLGSARYPRMEFTFTAREQALARRQIEMFVDIGALPRAVPVEELFLV